MGAQSKKARKIRESEEFDPAQLRAAMTPPKDGGVPLVSWKIADIMLARDLQMRGQFYQPARMAEAMRTDDALFVAFEGRLAPSRCIGVELVAAKGARGASIKEEAEGSFGQCGVGVTADTIASIHACLTNHDVAFGLNVATPREDGSRIDFVLQSWPIEYVRWDNYRQSFYTRIDPSTASAADMKQDPALGFVGAYEAKITHGDGRWVIFQKFSVDPFKHAAILSAAFVWARHAYAVKDWSKGSVSHGSAKVVGTMPEAVPMQEKGGGLTAEAAAMAEMLRAIASGDSPVALKPFGSEVEFLTNDSTAWQVWAELVLNAERSAARIYLGTDGILGAQGGAPGVNVQALFGVAATKVEGDLKCIQRGIDTGVIEPWCAMNFGDSTLAPTRRYLLPDADADAQRAALATRTTAFYDEIDRAKASGFVITREFVARTARKHDVKAPPFAVGDVTVNEGREAAGLRPLLMPDGVTADPDGFLSMDDFEEKMSKASDARVASAAVPEQS